MAQLLYIYIYIDLSSTALIYHAEGFTGATRHHLPVTFSECAARGFCDLPVAGWR